MKFIQTNPLAIQVFEAIKNEKENALMSLINELNDLFNDGTRCLKEIVFPEFPLFPRKNGEVGKDFRKIG